MNKPTDKQTDNTLVVENEALRRGFTITPNYILRNPELSFGARLTYSLLLSYAWQEGSCFPGQRKLADDLRTEPRSVRRYLAELKRQKLVRVERRGLGRTNFYVLTDFQLRAEADRTQLSSLDRTGVSDLERTPVSDKEDSEVARHSTDNRFTVDRVLREERGLSQVAGVLARRAVPTRRKVGGDKKVEVAPLAEEAARKLDAPQSLGMFYKVLLQLYPEHCHLFEQAVKEAAMEPRARVSRSALFAHIVKRLSREHGVPLRLGRKPAV